MTSISVEKETVKQTRQGIKKILHTLYMLTILTEISFIVLAVQVWDPLFITLIMIDVLLFVGIILIVNKEFDELFLELEETLKNTREQY